MKTYQTLAELAALRPEVITLDGLLLSSAQFIAPATRLYHPPGLVIADAAFCAQLRLVAALKLAYEPGATVQGVFQEALADRPRLVDYFDRASSVTKLIRIQGSSRDRVLTRFPDLPAVNLEIGRQGVRRGFSVLNGGSDTGVMGSVSRAWNQAILEQPGTGSRILLVGLKILAGEHFEQVQSSFATPGDEAPGLACIVLRAFFLQLAGAGLKVSVYEPGGCGTGAELLQELESYYLGDGVWTAASHRRGAPHVLAFLNPKHPGNGGERFWDDKRAWIEKVIESELNDRGNFPRLEFIPTDDPIEAAARVYKLAES